MWYRYFVDFRNGILVFHNFSYGIAVLSAPQCSPQDAWGIGQVRDQEKRKKKKAHIPPF